MEIFRKVPYLTGIIEEYYLSDTNSQVHRGADDDQRSARDCETRRFRIAWPEQGPNRHHRTEWRIQYDLLWLLSQRARLLPGISGEWLRLSLLRAFHVLIGMCLLCKKRTSSH